MTDRGHQEYRSDGYNNKKFEKSPLDYDPSSKRGNNMVMSKGPQDHSSRHGRSNTYYDQQTGNSGTYSQNRSHEVPSSEGFYRQPPSARDYGTEGHHLGAMRGDLFKGDYHIKDELADNRAYKNTSSGSRSYQQDGRMGNHRGDQAYNPQHNLKRSTSDSSSYHSSGSKHMNYPMGHPNHNPHLPPPNPFAHHRPSYNLDDQSSKPTESPKKSGRVNDFKDGRHRSGSDHYQGHPDSTSGTRNSETFDGT